MGPSGLVEDQLSAMQGVVEMLASANGTRRKSVSVRPVVDFPST